MRTRNRAAVIAVLSTGLVLGLSTAASASFTNYLLQVGPPTTKAKGTSGSGSIRAGQYCESSSGQTNWYSYGSWVSTLNVWSTTGSCTYVNYGFADLT